MAMLHIQDSLYLDERELDFGMIRAQGAGGQNVNKVASAVHLRFDVRTSSLPEEVKEAVLAMSDRRLSKEGVLVIKRRPIAARTRIAPRRSNGCWPYCARPW